MSEQMIVSTQLTRIHVLLHKVQLMAYKIDLVVDLTNGREQSTKSLTFNEANKMIAYLEQKQQERNKKAYDRADAMRKKIIVFCRETGWVKNGKADMSRIYSWVEKYGYLHKPLRSYTEAELPRLVTQAENMRNSFIKALNK